MGDFVTMPSLSFFRLPVVWGCALLAAPQGALAQSNGLSLGQAALEAPGEGFHLSVASRVRYETIENTPRTLVSPSENWWSFRTNLAASWQSGPIRLAAELTDSRVYGEHPGSVLTSNDVNAFEPTQLYLSANLGAALGRGSSVKLTAGRMALNLGSRRLIAADDYRNAANTYTGVRVDASAGRLAATAIYMLPLARLPDDPYGVSGNRVDLDKESLSTILWGGLVHHASGPEVSFYHFRERDWPGHATRDRDLNTAGLRFYRGPRAGHLDGEVEAMYQWGHESASILPTAARLEASATFVHAHVGYTLAHRWHPRVALEFDRASGDGPGATYGRFDTLYGMRRGDFAPAGLYAAVGRANIASPAVRVEAAPSQQTDLSFTWRPMWLADWHDSFSNTSVRDSSGRSGDFAGHQFDLRLRAWLIPRHVRAEWDGLILAKGRFLTTAPNAPKDGDTGYTSLSVTVVF